MDDNSLLASRSQSSDPKDWLGLLLASQGGEGASQSAGISGLISTLFMGVIALAMQLDHGESQQQEDSQHRMTALVCQRYGMTKHLKEDSVAYLKGWLDTLKEEPTFIKTVLNDVKKSSSMIIDRIETVKRDMEVKLDVREDETQTVAIDESGDAQLVEGESLGADRKQGDNEENSEEEEEEQEEETKRVARSLGRGR